MTHNPDLDAIEARAKEGSDWSFVAHSYADIPLLIAAVRERDELIGRLVGALKTFAKNGDAYRLDPHVLVMGRLFSESALHGEHFYSALALIREIESPKEPQF